MVTILADPIADMLTRIRNAINVRKGEVLVPHSKVKEAVAQVLASNKFIDSVATIEIADSKMLKIVINGENSSARITEIVRLSKPGRRVYANVRDIPTVKQGRGIVIVSTSQGLMTGVEAKNKRLGGELICKVY
jgi:small subunit ribosomal protein S8